MVSYIQSMFINLTPYEIVTLLIGFSGQAIFSARFLVQWLYSEKIKKSVVPVAFWYLSLFGGLSLLVYAILRRDPVIIAGNLTGSLIYLRNIYFIHRERQFGAELPPAS